MGQESQAVPQRNHQGLRIRSVVVGVQENPGLEGAVAATLISMAGEFQVPQMRGYVAEPHSQIGRAMGAEPPVPHSSGQSAQRECARAFPAQRVDDLG